MAFYYFAQVLLYVKSDPKVSAGPELTGHTGETSTLTLIIKNILEDPSSSLDTIPEETLAVYFTS